MLSTDHPQAQPGFFRWCTCHLLRSELRVLPRRYPSRPQDNVNAMPLAYTLLGALALHRGFEETKRKRAEQQILLLRTNGPAGVWFSLSHSWYHCYWKLTRHRNWYLPRLEPRTRPQKLLRGLRGRTGSARSASCSVLLQTF